MIHTVDGQNPAPPRMMIISLFVGFLTIPGGAGSLPATVYIHIMICCYQAYQIPIPLHDLDVGGQQRRLKEQAAIDAIRAREVRVFGRLDGKTKHEEYDLNFNTRLWNLWNLWINMICWMFRNDVSSVKIKHHLLYCFSSVRDFTTCWLLDGTVYHGRTLQGVYIVVEEMETDSLVISIEEKACCSRAVSNLHTELGVFGLKKLITRWQRCLRTNNYKYYCTPQQITFWTQKFLVCRCFSCSFRTFFRFQPLVFWCVVFMYFSTWASTHVVAVDFPQWQPTRRSPKRWNGPKPPRWFAVMVGFVGLLGVSCHGESQKEILFLGLK